MNNSNIIKTFLCFLFLSLGFSSCVQELDKGLEINYENTIKTRIDTDPQFSFYRELYKITDSLANVSRGITAVANVGGTLGTDVLTAFIPTNSAFTDNGITFVTSRSVNNLGNSSVQINPILLKFVVKDSTRSTNFNLNSVRNFLSYYLVFGKIVNQNEINKDLGLRAFNPGDSLYVKQFSNDFYLNATAKINVSGAIEMKNGKIFPINSLLTRPYNGVALAYSSTTNRIDTTLSLFNQALIRANDATITATFNATATTIYHTIFIPTNQAFRAAGLTSTVIAATTPANLATILRHHIVRRRLLTADLADGPLTMLSGSNLEITSGLKPTIKSAKTTTVANIVEPNILSLRGVMHKIDKVLLP